MGVALELKGRMKAPLAPGELLVQVERWLRAHCADTLDRCHRIDENGMPWLLVRLHPIAEEVRIGALGGDVVVAQAKTSPVGPGYHIYVCETLRRLGLAVRVDWERTASSDDSGYVASGDRGDVDRAMRSWIADVARRVLFLPPGSGAVALSMPADVIFHVTSHVITPLGPRDTEWLRRVAADDLATQRDFFAWWDEANGPDTMLARALCLMWTDVRWRAPLTDEEREIDKQVLSLLEHAHRLDISLDHPWREWAELLAFVDEAKGPLYEMVVRRASRVAETKPAIGYRRGPVTLQLPSGWRLTVPGSFTSIIDVASGGGHAEEAPRAIDLAPVKLPVGDARSADELLTTPEAGTGHGNGDNVIDHSTGALRLRGRLIRGQGGAATMLTGAIAAPGALAKVSLRYVDAADDAWARATFTSVGHERQ